MKVRHLSSQLFSEFFIIIIYSLFLQDVDDNNPFLTINTNVITMPENPIPNYISALEVFATDLDSDITNSQFYIELA
jgi:hypothetical protein